MNKKNIDLHIHSTNSDGLLTVAQIFEEAKKKGLKAISITDHDCVYGVKEAMIEAEKQEIEFVSGIEISSYYKNYDIHILGYFIDSKNSDLLEFQEIYKTSRYDRAVKMIAMLNEDGYKITIEDVLEFVDKGIVGRPHIAKALLEKGYAYNFKDAFDSFIGNNSKYYVKKKEQTPKDAIDLIHNAGGLAFLAHPMYLKNDINTIKHVISCGVDGLETTYPLHKNSDIKFFQNIVKSNGLLQSGGSDCHGGLKNGYLVLGSLEIPYDFIVEMKKKLNRV